MRTAFAILVLMFVASCGGTGDPESPAAPPNQPPTNSPPTISGTPATSVTEGQSYSFTPTASDPDGDTLTFSISGQPTWSSFDSGSGTLTGTPDASNIGTTADVTISVSDGTASASLTPFDLDVVQVQLGSATVSWDVPTTNADGSPLVDLAGYQVHYGQSSGSYTQSVSINDAATTSFVIENLAPGTWYFAVVAYDQTGNQSTFSAEASKVINP